MSTYVGFFQVLTTNKERDMGGSGSGRWRSSFTKYTVESGLSLSTRALRVGLAAMTDGTGLNARGTLSWGRGSEITDTIGCMVIRRDGRPVVRLYYTTTHWSGTKTEYG